MNALTKIETTALSTMTEQELVTVLQASLYPGAKLESIKMVLGYCKAAGLDPMQKPVHIVPMKVSTGQKDEKGWDIKADRDVIMPGVGLYRTQAARSGAYAGVSDAEFGATRELVFVSERWEDGENGRRVKRSTEEKLVYPEWCRVSVTRIVDGQPCDFAAREYWLENYATKGASSTEPNAMWKKRPFAQLAKCAEAQALRKAFPEMTGSQPTAEEMEGKQLGGDDDRVIDVQATAAAPAPAPSPAPGLPEFTQEQLDQRKDKIAEFYAKGKTADDIVAFYSLKSHLPDAMQKAIRGMAPKASGAAPAVTAQQLDDRMRAAKNEDALNEAASLMAAITDEAQRKELDATYEFCLAELRIRG